MKYTHILTSREREKNNPMRSFTSQAAPFLFHYVGKGHWIWAGVCLMLRVGNPPPLFFQNKTRLERPHEVSPPPLSAPPQVVPVSGSVGGRDKISSRHL